MSSVGGRLSGVPSRLALGGLGAGELLLSALGGLSPARAADVVGALAESNAVGTLLATVSLVGTELELLATVAGMLFFGYAVYEFLPQVFPDELDVVVGRRAYRLLASVLVVGSAEVIGGVILGASLPGRMVGLAFLVGVVALVACVGYVASVVYRDAADIEPAARAVSERLNVAGPGEGSEAIETASRRDRAGHIVSVGVMVAIPLPLLAVAVVAAGQLYPIPELLAVGWGVVGAVDARSDRAVLDRLPDRQRTDLEGSTFDLVVNAVRSQKGIPVVLVTLQGFIGAVVIVGVLNGQTPRFVREGLAAVGSDPLFAWSVLGMVVVLFASGLFAVWFWTRAIKRVPPYLRAWNVANAETSPLEDEELPEPVTRPVGLLVPFLVTIVPASVFVQALRFDYYFGARTAVLAAYAVVWPLSVALLAYCVRRTRAMDPQPALSDGRALPVALFVGWAEFLLLDPVVTYFGRASGMRFPPDLEGTGVIAFILVATAFMFVYPDLAARANDADGWRGHQQRLAMFGFGVACGVGGLVNLVPGFGLMLGLVAAMFVAAPVWEVATDVV